MSTSQATTHRERVNAALRLERPDGIPISFWGHNFARENSAEDLAQETARLALAYDWDFVKVQSRFSCFAEAWGARWLPSGDSTTRPRQVHPIIHSATDLTRLADSKADYGPLAEQIHALRLLRHRLGDDRPIIMTVFSPLMALAYMYPDEHDPRMAMLADLRENHELAAQVLSNIGDVARRFAEDCVDAGADGIFLASNLASSDVASEADLRLFERPYDIAILGSVSEAPFNMVHVCGARTNFGVFADYPAAVFNWALGDGNPTLSEGQQLTRRAVAGGLSSKPVLRTLTEGQVRAEASQAISDTGGVGLLLGPGCSIDADTPPGNLFAAAAVARDFTA